jgi:hypothetical protein
MQISAILPGDKAMMYATVYIAAKAPLPIVKEIESVVFH